ncbi:hypothetical protein GCM10010124_12900 [Pilimelia terevasa]|uniref:Uncharacterized protein n=1 Tax=Pilimelia terevasa TaxID=53372 RepID=A0A8J3BMJ9_9ACTN|nr:DUF6766 family protein [Pilimelia terevasa]GGK21845.1 hypothetical protein GCM10010124_12900 [Pilimelia terevasa]
MRRWVWLHSLSLVTFGAFAAFLVLQAYFGWQTENAELLDHGRAAQSLGDYLASGAFAEATFENWESEFLQMGSYVLLTAWLVQRGSAESDPPDRPREDAHEVRADSPWPVRRGGLWRRLYAHSLSAALFGMFGLSFVGHLLGGTAAYNGEQALRGEPPIGVGAFAGHPEFWFQSMQNWQSEFLAVGVLIVASIYLRERNSPESKAVAAPHGETGA